MIWVGDHSGYNAAFYYRVGLSSLFLMNHRLAKISTESKLRRLAHTGAVSSIISTSIPIAHKDVRAITE